MYDFIYSMCSSRNNNKIWLVSLLQACGLKTKKMIWSEFINQQSNTQIRAETLRREGFGTKFPKDLQSPAYCQSLSSAVLVLLHFSLHL